MISKEAKTLQKVKEVKKEMTEEQKEEYEKAKNG
jgi:hypothetical protein